MLMGRYLFIIYLLLFYFLFVFIFFSNGEMGV
jgi:hypothetical protein